MKRPAKAIVAVLAMLLTFALGASSALADTPPSVTIDPASEVGVTAAHLSGTVDPEGGPSTAYWRFEVAPADEPDNWTYAAGGEISAPDSEGSAPIAVEGNAENLAPNREYVARLVAENQDFANRTETLAPRPSFTTDPAVIPVLTAGTATNVEYTTAHFTGTIDPEGGNSNPTSGVLPIHWNVEVSSDGGASWNYVGGGELSGTDAESTSPVAVELDAGGLQPNTSYQFRLFAHYAAFAANVASAPAAGSFETDPVAKPTVVLDPVTAITSEAASFDGTVNPNAPGAAPQDPVFDTSWRFECEPACPSTPDAQTIAADNVNHAVSFDPKDLEPNTAYTVKLIASNLGGETVAQRSFKTASAGPQLGVGTVGALTHSSARLTAYVDANNTPTTVTFEYATDAGFSGAVVAPLGTTINGNGYKVAFADVTGLSPQTTYHWRVKAQSADGTNSDTASRAFATWAPPVPQNCPNEAVRIQQGAQDIAHCRAYELVSSGSYTIFNTGFDISTDGNRVAMTSTGADEATTSFVGAMLSDRTADGWKVKSALPSLKAVEYPEALRARTYSADLKTIIIGANDGALSGSRPGRSWRYRPDTGQLEKLAPVPGSEQGDLQMVASDDQRHVLRTSLGDGQIHESGNGPGPSEPVSFLPDGSLMGCTSGNIGFYGSRAKNSHEISVDGSRLYFEGGSTDCSTAQNLYLRQASPSGNLTAGDGAFTTLVSGPPLSGPEANAYFNRAAPDGSWVVYTTATRLDPADSNTGADLYRYTVGSGNDCLTCSVPEADVITPVTREQLVLAAESGERVYFSSRRALAPGAQPGIPNIYVWRATGDQIDLVAAAPNSLHGNTPQRFMAGTYQSSGVATPDGSVLVFTSNYPVLDSLTGTDNGSATEGLCAGKERCQQQYRYDDRDGSLFCVSCQPEGLSDGTNPELSGVLTAMLAGGGRSLAGLEKITSLTDDGRSYFFTLDVPLVAEDVNKTSDIYEWRDGHIALVSDGTSPLGVGGRSGNDSDPGLMGVTGDGKTVLFMQTGQLTAAEKNPEEQIYVARVNGGFLPPIEPAPCVGEACRGPNSSPPADLGVSTPGFSGPGNAKAKKPCAKGKTSRKGRCVSKPRKQKKKQKKQSKKRAAGKPGGKR